jgi:hypothetical protein
MIAAVNRGRRVTLGADKAHDAAEHIANLRAIGVTLHAAQTPPAGALPSMAAPPATPATRQNRAASSAPSLP